MTGYGMKVNFVSSILGTVPQFTGADNREGNYVSCSVVIIGAYAPRIIFIGAYAPTIMLKLSGLTP